MLPAPFQNCLILTGPTGSGKTALGVELAERLGAEIIALDSMTLYRGMDIGTAKPAADLRRRVPHHLIDVLEPWESASVAWWLKEAALCVEEIEQRGKRVLFVGGTPLYLKSLLRGLFDGPAADPVLRQRLTDEAAGLGSQLLHKRLAAVDPATAARLHPNDVRRIVRALEVWELTGQPISRWQTQWQQPANANSDPCRWPVLWVDLSRAELYARVNARVEQMLAGGLVDEVKALLGLPCPLSREAAYAVGYHEMLSYLKEEISLAEAVARIQLRSRHLAKRQLSWFRHLPECRPVSRELTFSAWGLTMND
jgi:tRNA dimethylallyltransferase